MTWTWCIGCEQNFNLTILLQPKPVPSHIKLLAGSEEKNNMPYISKISCNYLTDTGRSNNIQKKVKFGQKLEISMGWINKILGKRNVC